MKYDDDKISEILRIVSFARTDLDDVPFCEVLFFVFVSIRGRGVYLHTPTSVIYKKGKFQNWVKFMRTLGLKFEIVDRNVAVNINKVKHFDKKERWLYFDNEYRQKCPITYSHIKRLKIYLDSIN